MRLQSEASDDSELGGSALRLAPSVRFRFRHRPRIRTGSAGVAGREESPGHAQPRRRAEPGGGVHDGEDDGEDLGSVLGPISSMAS